MRRRARPSSDSGGHPAPTARHSSPARFASPATVPRPRATRRPPFLFSARRSLSPTPPLRRSLIAADPTAVGDCACACPTQLQPIIHYVTSNTNALLATVETFFYYHRSSDRRPVAANFITKPSFLDHANRVFTSSERVAKSCGVWTHFLGRQLNWSKLT